MTQMCGRCGRANPDEAIYCYQDGGVLVVLHPEVKLHTSLRPFPQPLSFPSGQLCLNFEQLLCCCLEDWTVATHLLREGGLERFFISMGRIDLARLAHAAARSADLDRGLDELLGRLPSQRLPTPLLSVTPTTLDLGNLRVGEDRCVEIALRNDGARLLYGSALSNQVWLTLGDTGASNKVFQFIREQTLKLWVRGQHLSASRLPREAQVNIESNGGSATLALRLHVSPQPFSQGALAGADSPRQLVDLVRQDPQAATPFFDNGSIADWYRRNGWPYPVTGPSAAGLDGVRQFFKALGLSDDLAFVGEPRTPAILPAPNGARPFPVGVLTGAAHQGQLVEKVRAMPIEVAPLFESGAVADWYEQNGWVYPVQGPRAVGVDAVYQFLKVVEGSAAPLAVVVKAPPAAVASPVAIPTLDPVRPKSGERAIHLCGRVGEQLRHVLSAKSKKGTGPVRAQASSDQPWLDIGATKLEGSGATIVLVVATVPDRPGETLHARVRVTVNDAQSFVVPVTLLVGARSEDYASPASPVSS